jgi:uncharacterized protein
VPAVTHYFLLSLVAVLPAIFLGRVANHRLQGEAFLNIIHGGLVCIGLILLVQAVRHP